jgi:hypothetical protein
MIKEIPTSCTNGNCKKSLIEKANCDFICNVAEEDLPKLDCWNGGKGFHISSGGINMDPVLFNKIRTLPGRCHVGSDSRK